MRRLAAATGRPFERVEADLERREFLDADGALEYGLIDEIERPGPRSFTRSGRLKRAPGERLELSTFSVNSELLCRLSYPGMASDDSKARISPMISRCVVEQQ